MLSYVQKLLSNSQSTPSAFLTSNSDRRDQASTSDSSRTQFSPLSVSNTTSHRCSEVPNYDALERAQEIADFLSCGQPLHNPRKTRVMTEARSGASHRMSTIKESPVSESRFGTSVRKEQGDMSVDEEGQDREGTEADGGAGNVREGSQLQGTRTRIQDPSMEEIDLGSPRDYEGMWSAMRMEMDSGHERT